MAQDFRGTGWRFPILPDELGTLGYVDGDENVEQSLKILLLTALGERVMRPDFGTELLQQVFAPGSTQNLQLLETAIRDAVRDWEPRIDLDEVHAEMDPSQSPDADVRAIVSIRYRVRQSNTQANLVFPFYLGAVGGA
jgi:phage baseplate assembly protein W